MVIWRYLIFYFGQEYAALIRTLTFAHDGSDRLLVPSKKETNACMQTSVKIDDELKEVLLPCL